MMYALDNGERVKASPGGGGVCPMCEGEVVPKCGSIVSWHWAHKVKDCDTWSEGESDWHINWKEEFPEECREVVMRKEDTVHRADVSIGGKVIEFQKSSISEEDIFLRECFYKNMVWVICASDFEDNFDVRDRGGYFTFRWKYPRKSWWVACKPIYLDFGEDTYSLFKINRLYDNVPCGGSGSWVTKGTFLNIFRDWPMKQIARETNEHHQGKEAGPVCN